MPLSFEEALLGSANETAALLDKLLPLSATPALRLIEAMRYAALGQGKRLRPFLVVETANLYDVPRERALRVGAALECVHCYSLVHDDLPAMDNDDLRRGNATTHRAFDEATAILAGDGLLTYAFEILSDPATHPTADIRLQLVGGLARAAGMAGMVGGQMLDIEGVRGMQDITHMQKLKTGALFRFACEAGAVLAQAEPAPLRRYADLVGLAYQIADDILDRESTPAEQGKATFVELLGLQGAKTRAEALVTAAIAALEPYGARAEMLRQAARFVVGRGK